MFVELKGDKWWSRERERERVRTKTKPADDGASLSPCPRTTAVIKVHKELIDNRSPLVNHHNTSVSDLMFWRKKENVKVRSFFFWPINTFKFGVKQVKTETEADPEPALHPDYLTGVWFPSLDMQEERLRYRPCLDCVWILLLWILLFIIIDWSIV